MLFQFTWNQSWYIHSILCDVVVVSIWSCLTGKSVWNGRCLTSSIHDTHHERPGARWNLCSLRNDLCHRQWVFPCLFILGLFSWKNMFFLHNNPFSFCPSLRWFDFERQCVWILHHSVCCYSYSNGIICCPSKTGKIWAASKLVKFKLISPGMYWNVCPRI